MKKAFRIIPFVFITLFCFQVYGQKPAKRLFVPIPSPIGKSDIITDTDYKPTVTDKTIQFIEQKAGGGAVNSKKITKTSPEANYQPNTLFDNFVMLNSNINSSVYAASTNVVSKSSILPFSPILATLPFTENFAAATIPSGWITQNVGTGITERWSISTSANSGGAANELLCTFQNINPGTTRFITPPLNTVGLSNITLVFKHQLHDFGTGATLRIQSSKDLATWTNESWSIPTNSGTILNAETVSLTITNNLNSATTYLAFEIDGNLYQFDFWYIDDVSVTGGSTVSLPTISNKNVLGITSNTATSGGSITSDGGSPITVRGVCWSTSPNPTISSSITLDGTGAGVFYSSLTGLTANTLYYLRSYATNSSGTAYGPQVTFTTINSSTFSSGSGTSNDPYLIATPDHLNNVRLFLGASNADVYFKQTSNIDLGVAPWNQGLGWLPIGDATTQFYGHYDGFNYTISGLTINRPAENYVGLFGWTRRGSLENIGLLNVNILGNQRVSALAAKVQDNGYVYNCYSTGIVKGQLFPAGLIANLYYGATLENSYSTVIVQMIAGTNNQQAGGLVARALIGNINNCYATGKVEGLATSTGGLVGLVTDNSVISNSYATGEVTGGAFVGGLIGGLELSSVTNSYSTGRVTYTSSGGGLVGYLYPAGATVTSSFWNSESSGQPNSAIGVAKTSLQMVSSATYTGWTFGSAWSINEGTTYPYLAWQTTPGSFNYPTNIPASNLIATPANGTITLTWNAPSIGTVTGYKIYRDGTFYVTNTSNTYTDAGLTNYVTHTYYVNALNGSVESPSSNTASSFSHTGFSGGDGSIGSPYLISNPGELYTTRLYLSSNFKQIANINLGVAPWNTTLGWAPIGAMGNAFTGTYDGSGFTISNLTINRPTETAIGLFGSLQGSTIKNLSITLANITGNDYVGILAGDANNSYITNITTNGTISAVNYAGGIVGDNYYTSLNLSKSSGTLNTTGNWTGGLSGLNYTSSIINSSFSSMAITSSGYTTGGLSGTNEYSSTINNSYFTGSVSGTQWVGGIVGWVDSSAVSMCYSIGSITGTSPATTGGLVGSIVNNGVVNNSYWNTVTSGQTTSSGGSGRITADMKYPYTAGTYLGWDFTNVWANDAASTVNSGYPYLLMLANSVPSVVTNLPQWVSTTTAKVGGNVSFDGGSTVTAKGVCWNTITGPTVALATKTNDGTSTGAFISTITGLVANTTYYYRAYATNTTGTSYGVERTFFTQFVPIISSFTPSSGPIGTTVTITGNNFSTTPANNTVYFGGVKATVTASTSTTLSVTVPYGATYQPISVTVGGLTAYSSKPFSVTFTSLGVVDATSFPARADFAAGTAAYSSALGDLDGDGKLDMVVTNNTANTISLFRNTSTSGTITTGSFAAKVDITTGTWPEGVAIGDIDGDGKLDVVVVNFNSTSVSIFRNIHTSGAFTPSSFAAKVDLTTGSSPEGVAIGDIDGDGKPDLAVTNFASNTVSVFRNISTAGTISLSPKADLVAATGPVGVALSDLDRDGKLDLAITNSTAGSVSVFRNISVPGTISTSSFAAKVDFTAGTNPRGITIGDIDGDGLQDVAVSNLGSISVSVFRNISTAGTFTASSLASRVDFPCGTGAYLIAMGDLDGNGKPDLAVSNNNSTVVSVFKNTSTSGAITAGSFATKVDFTVGTQPAGVSIGDMDGDGKLDLTVVNYTNGNISVLRNTIATLILPSITSFSPISGPIGTTVTITGNNFSTTPANNVVWFGAVKATVTAATATSLTVTVPTGATYKPITVTVGGQTAFSSRPFVVTFPTSNIIDGTSFLAPFGFAAGTSPFSSAIGDIDGDGKPDLVVTNSGSTLVSVYRNTSTSGSIDATSFPAKFDFTVGSSPMGLAIADVDCDGKLDLIVANSGSTSISVLRNTSTSGSITAGSFATKIDFATGTAPYDVAAGDFDGDGKPDIAVTNNTANTVSVFRNTSTSGTITSGSFSAKVDFTTGTNPEGLVLGDIDGDGKLDMVAVNTVSNSISVFRNISSLGSITASSFVAKIDFTTGANPHLGVFGDIDGDGKPDITVSNGTDGTVSVFRNTSTSGSITASSLAAKVDFTVGVNPRGIALGDFDGDGKQDIVASNQGAASISVLKNTCTSGTITTGSFATKYDMTLGSTNPYGVAIGDVDGDGKPDIAVASYSGNSVSVIRNKIAGASLVAYFPFTGNANDASGYNHNGTPTAITYVTDRFGVASGAAQFNGTTSTILIGSGLNLVNGGNKFTFSAWVNPSVLNVAAQNTILSERFGAGDNYQFAIFNKYILSTYWTGGVEHTFSGHEIYLNTWQFVTVTYDGANLLFYVNGQLDQTYATTGLIDNFVSNLHIGSINGTNDYFNGAIDEVRIYNRTLPSTEINTLYHEGGWAPSPTITSFTPASGPIGTTVTITGANFNSTAANNIVYFGAVKATVTASTSTSLSVTVPTGATYQPISVTVGGLTAYSSKPFNVTFPSSQVITASSFESLYGYLGGIAPSAIASGDLDGDGKVDFVMANSSSNTISLYRNTSTSGSFTASTFAAKVDLATSTGPSSLAIADLDGDGKLDIAVTCGVGGVVSLFKNISTSGSITTSSFATRVDLTASGGPNGIAIGDIDGDGKPEMAVACYTNILNILQNTSVIGTISFSAKVDFVGATNPRGIAIGDIDGDGKLDVVTSNEGSSNVSVFRNATTGVGTITTSSLSRFEFATAANPWNVKLADINIDNKLDIVTGNGIGSISILQNTATAGTLSASSFAAKVDITAAPNCIAIGDLDGDAKPDIAFSSSGTITSVLKNQGTPGATISSTTFAAKVDTNMGNATSDVTIADVDGDSKPDILYAGNNTMTAQRNIISLPLPPTITSFSPISGPIGAAVTITGTNFSTTPANNVVWFGGAKATVTAATSTSITVTVPTGATYQPITVTVGGFTACSSKPFNVTFASSYVIDATSFATKVDFATGSIPAFPSVVDIDGDGKTDIIVVNNGSTSISAFRNISTSGNITTGSIAGKIDFTTLLSPWGPAVGDIDGDGKQDVVIVDNGSGSISVFRNTSTSGIISSGSFATKVDFTTGTGSDGPQHVAIGDLDIDGKPDLVVSNGTSNTVSVFRNISTSGSLTTASFATKVEFTTGTNSGFISLRDIDGDGKLDIIVLNNNGGSFSILRNISTSGSITTSSFSPKVDFTSDAPWGLAIGDIDGDGKPDIITSSTNNGTISIFRNISTVGSITTGSLATKVDFTVGNNPLSIAIGDIDGDNRPDIATSNKGSNTISVLKNTSTSGSITTSSLTSKVDFSTSTAPWGLAIGDIDGDGKPDLVVANNGGNTVSVLRNTIPTINNSITFQVRMNVAMKKGRFIPATDSVIVRGVYNGWVANTDRLLDADADSIYTGTFNVGTATPPEFKFVKRRSGNDDWEWHIGNRTYTPTGSPQTLSPVYFDNDSTTVLPTITSFSPAFGPVGTSVTITGTNFSPTLSSNVVWFGAVRGTVTTATATQLTVLVPPGATYQPIAVMNSSSGLSAYSSKPFIVTFPSISVVDISAFAAKADLTAGTNPYGMAIGDLDNDGKLDIAVTNDGSNTVSVYRNISTSGSLTASSFTAKVDLVTGTRPLSVAIGDINCDGNQDIVVTNYTSNTISVFKNTFYKTPGTLSFEPKVDFTTSSNPINVAIGDIDKDGKPDIAVTNDGVASVSVFRNTNNGSMLSVALAAKVDFTTGTRPNGIVIGDIDADGKPDLVIANDQSGTVSVLKNTSTSGAITAGSFATKVDFTAGVRPMGISLGDLDGDGKPDMVVSNYTSGTASIFWNAGVAGTIALGTFNAKVDFTCGTGAQSVAIGDIDGDGKLDLAVANSGSNNVSILKNNSTPGAIIASSFASKVNFTTGSGPYIVAIGDFDGDGKPDLATSNNLSNSVSVFRNTVAASATAPTITSFTPSSGLVGSTVTINGTNFGATQGTSTVKFGTTNATPTSWSATQIIVTVPTLADGLYTLSVTTSVGLANSSTQFTVTSAATPTISSFTPSTGLVGSSVTINGTNFGTTQGTSTVKFGTTSATPTSWSATQIIVTVPTLTDGLYTISVTTTAGTANSLTQYTVTSVSAPTISSFTPSSGLVGSSVTINGTNFGATIGTSTVKFGTTLATLSYWSATQIIATVPNLTVGAYTITVTTSGGVANSSTQFTVTATSTPTISSFTPSSGLAGSSITINGTNFGGSQGASTVKFGTTTATATSWSSVQIIATVPALTAGSYTISVTTTGGVANSSTQFIVTSSTSPTISSFSPSSGMVGSSVTVNGTNFGATQGTSTIKFGTTAAVTSNWSATQIVATVPTLTAGSYTISVTTANGTVNSSTQFNVTTQQCTVPLVPKKKGSLNILICQTPNATYQWYKDDVAISGATKQFYIARKTYGSYSVQVSLTNGCSDRSPAIQVSTGGSISVYPNPGDKVFNVELNFEDMGFTTIKLVNAFGTVKRVITVNKDTDIQTIPISIEDLEKGIYVIDVEVNGEKIETQKVVII